MAGRPSKKRDAVKEAILAALRAGNTRTAAAAAAGVHRDTLRVWVQDDPAFSVSVEKAEAEAEKRFLRVVEDAAVAGTWQAAAWWLERRRKDEYALKQIQQHEGNAEKPIPMRIEVIG